MKIYNGVGPRRPQALLTTSWLQVQVQKLSCYTIHMHLVYLLLNVQRSSILRSSTLKIHYSSSRRDTLLTTAAPDGIHY